MSGTTQPPLERDEPDLTLVALFLHALRLAGGMRRGFVLDSLDLVDYEPAAKA